MEIPCTSSLFQWSVKPSSPHVPIWISLISKITRVAIFLSFGPFALAIDLYNQFHEWYLDQKIMSFEGMSVKEAVDWGLQFQDRRTRKIYRDLLIHDGFPEEGEAPIDIFQWAATCQVIQRHLSHPEPFYKKQSFWQAVCPQKNFQLSQDESRMLTTIQEIAFDRTQNEEFRREYQEMKVAIIESSMLPWLPCRC